MPDKKKKDDRLKIEDHTQSHSSNTGAATVAAGVGGLYASKKLFDLGKPVVSRGVNASMDAAKTFKDKGLKGAWKDVKASMSKQLTPKGKNLPSIYVSTAADNIGLKHTGQGHGRALPKSEPDFPKVSRSAYNKPHNLQMYDDLASKVGPSNVVPGPSGTPQLGHVTKRGQNINYGQVRKEGFLETNRMQNKIQKIEMNLAKDIHSAETKYGKGGFGDIDDIAKTSGRTGPTHSNAGNKLPSTSEMKATRLDKTIDTKITKAVSDANTQLDVTVNKAMGHSKGGVTIKGSATTGNVNLNMQQYNPGVAGGSQTTPQSMQGINANKGPAGSTNLPRPGKGKIATKGVQLLGGRVAILGLGAKSIPLLGNTLMAADVAGVSYKTAASNVTARTPAEKVSAGFQTGKEIVGTWKNRASSFKNWTQSNMQKSRQRKAEIRRDIYGQKKK
jgi:hypothetical protein